METVGLSTLTGDTVSWQAETTFDNNVSRGGALSVQDYSKNLVDCRDVFHKHFGKGRRSALSRNNASRGVAIVVGTSEEISQSV